MSVFIGMSIHDQVTPYIGDLLMVNMRSMNCVSNKNRFVWRNLAFNVAVENGPKTRQA